MKRTLTVTLSFEQTRDELSFSSRNSVVLCKSFWQNSPSRCSIVDFPIETWTNGKSELKLKFQEKELFSFSSEARGIHFVLSVQSSSSFAISIKEKHCWSNSKAIIFLSNLIFFFFLTQFFNAEMKLFLKRKIHRRTVRKRYLKFLHKFKLNFVSHRISW